MLVERLKDVMEENGPENQCGFHSQRGTIDGTFNLLMALRKRQEHNLETYVSFVDLVKAFDSVPRAALFKVLRRYGLPDHFINLVIRLYADAVVNFKLGKEEVEVKNRHLVLPTFLEVWLRDPSRSRDSEEQDRSHVLSEAALRRRYDAAELSVR